MYQERNPKATIEVLPLGQGEQHSTKLVAMATAGDRAGVHLRCGLQPGGVRRARDASSRWTSSPRATRSTSSVLREVHRALALDAGGKQQLYAIPLHPNPAALFYNKDLFAQRGLKAPDATWTWDTLLDKARKLATPEEPAVEAPFEPIALWATVRSLGGDILDKDWKRYTLDQPAGAPAVQWIADLALRHKVAVPRSQVAAYPFTQGKVGIKWDIFPTIESIKVASRGEFGFDVAPLPKGPQRAASTAM